MTEAERNELIEQCALAAEAQDREGYEWVRDSLWSSVLRRAGSNVRMLKTTPIAKPGFELATLRRAIIDNTRGNLFWIGEILLGELEKETGFKGDASQQLVTKDRPDPELDHTLSVVSDAMSETGD